MRSDACGPNLKVDALVVVCALNDRVAVLFGTSRRGSVFVFQENTPSCSTTSLNKATVLVHGITHGGAVAGDRFGAALAVGDLDGDGKRISPWCSRGTSAIRRARVASSTTEIHDVQMTQ